MDPDHIFQVLGDLNDQDTRAAFVTVLMPVIRGMELYIKNIYTERYT